VKPCTQTVDPGTYRILLALGFVVFAYLSAAEVTNRSPVAVWDVSVRAEIGAGYKHNVLLTSVAPESSAFVSVAADASFIRLSESGSEWTMFFLGQDMQFTDVPSVDGERFASGMIQFVHPLSLPSKLGIELYTLYQNQVMDVSESETNLARMLVEGVDILLTPKWYYTLGAGREARCELFGGPQLYAGDLDGYWQTGAKLALVQTYGNKSELSLSSQFANWIYDSREQADATGASIPGTTMAYWRPEISGQWRHHWDTQRRWTSTTRLSWLWNVDNGSGYWNYDRLTFSQRLRWRPDRWEVVAGARLGWYFYDVQTVGQEHRERFYATLDFRAERRLSKRWFVYASAEADWNWSNEPLDTYSDWTVGAGFGAEF
jgi:hypothetical protein